MTTQSRSAASNRSGLRATIGLETARLCEERYAGRLRAVILAGSLARDEATWRTDGGTMRALGDAEFLVVFNDGAPLPEARSVERLARSIESHLAKLGLFCPITLSPVHSAYLRELPPTIFAYELRTTGQLVWGDATALSLVPMFAASDVPLEDAWRLLCNRLVEQLEVTPDLATLSTDPSEAVLYRAIKLNLDMATSLLVFLGHYEPTYRERAERLRELARGQTGRNHQYPFRLEPFARIVDACTEWKLEGSDRPVPEGVSWGGGIDRAHSLWRWELAHLGRASPELPDQALLAAWLERQPAIDRCRGWLHVLRKCGWLQSWGLWPRWIRLLRRGSPRYLVYAVACRLLFELRRLEAEDSGGAPGSVVWEGFWKDLSQDLPVIRPWTNPHRLQPWQQAASEITWSYREFLVGTRA